MQTINQDGHFVSRVEAITPPGESQSKESKEGLLHSMDRIEREITEVESQISKLKKNQQDLEDRAAKPPEPEKLPSTETVVVAENRQQSLMQIIYSENRKKAEEAHNMFAHLGPTHELPLYNQPSDSEQYMKNIKTNEDMRKKLIQYFKKRNATRKKREKYLCDRYDQLMLAWEKRVERVENNAKRKARDAKAREFYEKQFPEIRKQREQQERISRAGTRGSWGNIARSEAELDEIVVGLNEQETSQRHMRSLSVVPPMLYDAEQRRLKYINNNGLIEDPLRSYKERQQLNIWTDQEKEIFREKFSQYPKNFHTISSYLERKACYLNI